MARQRNNIYAVTADAVDLALDTAGTIGSMVGGVAHMVGIGKDEEPIENREQEAADATAREAEARLAMRLNHEANAIKPRSHKAKTSKRQGAKTRSAKSAKSVKKLAKRRAAR